VAHKKEEENKFSNELNVSLENLMFPPEGWRGGSFSCSMEVLHEGLRSNILHFLKKESIVDVFLM
jgi:hypothetical protein